MSHFKDHLALALCCVVAPLFLAQVLTGSYTFLFSTLIKWSIPPLSPGMVWSVVGIRRNDIFNGYLFSPLILKHSGKQMSSHERFMFNLCN